MIDFTPVSRPFFAQVRRNERRERLDVERSQRATLSRLLRAVSKTDNGREHQLSPADSYAVFASKLPCVEYEDIRPAVNRMLRGERDVLWPGVCRRYAQSSGTSGGKSKYIPLTRASLNGCHYAGAAWSVASYLGYYPDSRIFGGKNFILGGSFANEIADLPAGVKVGDLSASLIDRINPVVNLFRVPDKKTALMADWEVKLPALARAAARVDVRSLSGVPSWFAGVLKEVLRITGASDIHEVWPGLEVFFHGGIAFPPYKSQYDELTEPSKMRYWENYNASEGFFAVQDRPGSPELGLLLDADVFYEFIPLSDTSRILPAWEVTPGEVYEMVISSSNGLMRYRLGDTVMIERAGKTGGDPDAAPLTVTIAGRTKSFINAFGEELMVYNADAAMTRAASQTGAEVADYTAAPVYAEGNRRGRHQWVIEFTRPPQGGIDTFAEILDRELQRENSDYQAKRAGGLFLEPPEIIVASPGLFNRWLGETGKLGGQRKMPRLSNDRKIIDNLLKLNENH